MTTPPSYEILLRRDVRVPTTDEGMFLSADLYLPDTSQPVPALISAYPYRKDVMGPGMEPTLRWFAARGYACLLLDLRGTGSSDGTRHPVVGIGEGEDCAAAIAWVAAQPWCTSAVGMWGISYGCVATLRTAACKPPELKAIIPMMGPIDPGDEAFHFHGQRLDMLQRGHWGAGLLALQLLPPLLNHDAPEEQRRWQQRLDEDPPYLLDLAVPANDVSWAARRIEVSAIDAPTLVVGGWRDLYVDAAVDLYRCLSVPKRLLIGPWGHTMPHDSPLFPVDFPELALRWWDRWLHDEQRSAEHAPPVELFTMGEPGGWRAFSDWPETSTRSLFATARGTLGAGPGDVLDPDIGRYEPDPTIGILSGLQGMGRGDLEVPLDQHDDDVRTVHMTSDPLDKDIVLCGSVRVEVETEQQVQRLVVRLAEVDGVGRSRHVATGVLTADPASRVHGVRFGATCRRISTGQRLRVALSDADFPRLMPLAHPSPFGVRTVRVDLPVLDDRHGTAVELPALDVPSAAAVTPGLGSGSTATARWSVTSDLLARTTSVTIGAQMPAMATSDGHELETDEQTTGFVAVAAPAEATVTTSHVKRLRMSNGSDVVVEVNVRCTQELLTADGAVTVNGRELKRRTWSVPLEES